MPFDSRRVFAQARNFTGGLTVRQLAFLGGSLVAVAGALWLFVSLLGKGDYKALYTNLSPPEAESIAQRLASENVPFELSNDHTGLSVPADQIDKVRLQLASKGLPVTGRLGFELFDKPNWAGSDFDEKVNYQRALEGELERTIESLSDVEGARVHLVLARESLFIDREREAKAAVLVRLRGPRLSEDSINAITYLVASSVDNLKPENVTVVDADGRVPISNHGGSGAFWSQGNREFEAALVQKLTATLAPVVGPEHIRASVAVDFDYTSSDTTQESYDPNGAVPLTSQITSDQMSDTAGDGVPGTSSNAPQARDAKATPAGPSGTKVGANSPQAAAAATDDLGGDEGASEGERSESKTFAVSKTLKHTLQPPGNIRKISAVLLLDDAVSAKDENGTTVETRRKRTPEELKQIQDLASGAIGIDIARGDKLTVEAMSFTQPLPEKIAPPTLSDRVLPIVNRWSTLIRYFLVGLLFMVIYLIVLRPMKRQFVIAFSETPVLAARGQRAALVGSTDDLRDADAGAYGALLGQGQQSAEPRRGVGLTRALVSRVEKDPEEASRVIQTWLLEDQHR